MKAQLVISTEYWANKPSVFLQTNEKYYGCLIYPRARNFPDKDYWLTATCSDDGRYFEVSEVKVNSENLQKIEELQTICDTNRMPRKSYPYISCEWKIRRGKVYEAWKSANDAQQAEIKAEQVKCAPFDKIYNEAFNELRSFLLGLKQ